MFSFEKFGFIKRTDKGNLNHRKKDLWANISSISPLSEWMHSISSFLPNWSMTLVGNLKLMLSLKLKKWLWSFVGLLWSCLMKSIIGKSWCLRHPTMCLNCIWRRKTWEFLEKMCYLLCVTTTGMCPEIVCDMKYLSTSYTSFHTFKKLHSLESW